MESVARRHQLRIARQTLRMPDVMVDIMGGMTKAEAEAIIGDYEGQRVTKPENLIEIPDEMRICVKCQEPIKKGEGTYTHIGSDNLKVWIHKSCK